MVYVTVGAFIIVLLSSSLDVSASPLLVLGQPSSFDSEEPSASGLSDWHNQLREE